METEPKLTGFEKASRDLEGFTSKIDKSFSKLKSFKRTASKVMGYGAMFGTAASVIGGGAGNSMMNSISGYGKPAKDAGIAEKIGHIAGKIGGAALGSVIGKIFGGPLGGVAGGVGGYNIGGSIGTSSGKYIDDAFLNPAGNSRYKTYGGDFYKGVDPDFYDQENSKRPDYSLQDQIANGSIDDNDARNAQYLKTLHLLHSELRQ